MRITLSLLFLFAVGCRSQRLTSSDDAGMPPSAADLSMPGAPLDLSSSPDLAPSPDLAICAGPPQVDAIPAAGFAWLFPCEALTLVGEHLDCAGTTVTLAGKNRGGTYTAAVVGASAHGQLAIRLPAAQQDSYALTVSNPAGTTHPSVTIDIGLDPPASQCAQPEACSGPPTISDFSPQIQAPCDPFAVRGANVGCLGATVTVGAVTMIRADAWLGAGMIGVRLPGAVDHDQAAPVVVTSPQGSAHSSFDFHFTGGGFDASVCP